MHPSWLPPACEQARSWIDRSLDNDLSAGELAELDAHVRHCPACAADLEQAQVLAVALRNLPRPLCPPHVAERVLAVAEAEVKALHVAEPGLWQRLVSGLHRNLSLSGVLQPALAGALALLLAAGLILNRPAERPAYSATEVAKAERELRLTLAYLGRMGSSTGEAVKQQVVTSVIAPTRRALSSEGNS